MSLDTALPYGLRDVKVYPLSGEVAGTGLDLPNSQTFSFAEAEDFAELRGDDATVAIRGKGASVNWSLAAGGVSLFVLKALYGGTITESGTTPNRKIRWRKNQNDARPYFKVQGKSLSDSGGDFHCVLYRARCTGELSGEMGDGNFWISGASGRAIGRTSDGTLYDFVQNESEVDVSVLPELDETVTLTITGSPTGGNFTLTFATDDTDPIPFNAAPAVVQAALEALASIGSGNVHVSGTAGSAYTVVFVGDLAATNVGAITAADAMTGGTTPGVTVAVVNQGGQS